MVIKKVAVVGGAKVSHQHDTGRPKEIGREQFIYLFSRERTRKYDATFFNIVNTRDSVPLSFFFSPVDSFCIGGGVCGYGLRPSKNILFTH